MKSEKADMFMAYAYVRGSIPMILSNKFLQRCPALPHVASVGLNVKGACESPSPEILMVSAGWC